MSDKIEIDQATRDQLVRGNDVSHRVFGWLISARMNLTPPWIIVDEKQRIRNEARAELLRELEDVFYR